MLEHETKFFKILDVPSSVSNFIMQVEMQYQGLHKEMISQSQRQFTLPTILPQNRINVLVIFDDNQAIMLFRFIRANNFV